MDKALLQHLVKLRRHLHKYPEIGFQEYNTRKVLEEEFKALGIAEENIHHAAETGMFVDIQGKAPASQEYQEDPSKLQPAPEAPNGQRIIAIRTDMDCLPLKETNEGLPYQSAIEKRAHMCGHDGHMANVCAVAHLVVRALDKIPSNCTVRLLCQPAEEGPGGAPPMIEDGCLEGVSGMLLAVNSHLFVTCAGSDPFLQKKKKKKSGLINFVFIFFLIYICRSIRMA